MNYTAGGNNRDPYAGVPEPRWLEQGSDNVSGPRWTSATLALCAAVGLGLLALGFVIAEWVIV